MKLWIQNGYIKYQQPTGKTFSYPVSQITRYVPNNTNDKLYIDMSNPQDSFYFDYAELTEFNGGAVPSFAAIVALLDAELGITVTLSPGDIEIGAVEIKNDVDDTRLKVLSNNAIKTDKSSIAGTTVAVSAGATNAGTQRVILASDDAAVTALQIMDDWDESDRAKVNLIAGQAGIAAGAGAVGASVPRVTLASDDPAVALLRTLPSAWGEAYASPHDFTAAYASANSITITGAPFTVDDSSCYVFKIVYKPSGGNWTALVNAHNSVSLVASSGTITAYGSGSPFAAGDTYRVVIFSQKKAYDKDNDSNNVIEQNPIWARYTDAEAIISSAQNFTASWADLGYEIDVRGYKQLIAYTSLTINSSINCRVRALAKYEAAGAGEYTIPIKMADINAVRIYEGYYEFGTDANQLIPLNWDVAGFAFVQLQIQCETVGGTAAQIASSYVTKIY